MKLTKLWASALGLLALASCSKDAEPHQPVEQPTTKVVHINLTAGQDDAGLRATYGVKTDESGALTGLQMSDKDVFLRVAVRQGTGTPVIQDIKFTKTAGRNHATYSGPITIPISGTGSYTIAAFLMKEDGADGEVFLTERETPGRPVNGIGIPYTTVVAYASSDNKLKLNVPYLTDWQPITVGTSAVNPTTLYLKPFGTILRMRIKNETASPVTFKQITFQTTAFGGGSGSDGGVFFPDLERDNKPYFTSFNSDYYLYTIPGTGIEVPGTTGGVIGYSPWMYIWVAPRTLTAPAATTAFLSSSTDATAPRYKAFYTTQYLPTGSVPVTLVYNADGHQAEVGELPEYDGEWGGTVPSYTAPLSLLHPYALNKTKDGFVTDLLMNNADVGRFTFDEVSELMTTKTIAGASYSIPTAEELRAIFPPRINSSGITTDGLPLNYPLYDVVEEGIKVGSSPVQSYKADYVRRSGVVYGIRLKSTSNRYRTAYRYRSYTEGTEKGVIVESTPIGSENISLSNIEQEAFWTSPGREVTSVKLPAYGSYGYPGGTPNFGGTMVFRTSTAVDEVAAYIFAIHPPTLTISFTPRAKWSYFPVYLFKRN